MHLDVVSILNISEVADAANEIFTTGDTIEDAIENTFEDTIENSIKDTIKNDSDKNQSLRVHPRLTVPGTAFTQREAECFFLLAQGFNNKKIAIKLDLSLRTVEMFIQNMRSKMGNIYKSELIEKAIEIYYSELSAE